MLPNSGFNTYGYNDVRGFKLVPFGNLLVLTIDRSVRKQIALTALHACPMRSKWLKRSLASDRCYLQEEK